MDNNTKYFIKFLSAFVNRQSPVGEMGIDWEQVYKLSKIHSVSGMVYLMAKELKGEYSPSPELFLRMKKDFLSTTMRAASQEVEMEAILKAMNEAQIPHTLMKGFVLRNYYPAREMRTMGDIDILIKAEDRGKSHKLFQELGYTPTITYGDVWEYKKDVVNLEIHTKIMPRNMHNGTDYVGYFSDAWEHVVATEAFTFEFEKEYHFLFLMVHMAKHFDGSGCGIRLIMDIAVFLRNFEVGLDWRFIEKELEKINLAVFSKNIYILCSRWFDTSFEFQLPAMEEGFYGELSSYILSSGTFGFHERNLYASALRNELLESKASGSKLNYKIAMLITCRSKLFPSYQTLSNSKHTAFVKNKPLLTPLGWFYRLACYAFEKPEKFFRVPYGIVKGKEESKKQFEVISKLGL